MQLDKVLGAASASRHTNDKERREVEAVEELKRLHPGVRGRLIDLIDPTQKKFETAICAALGRFINAVIVDTGDACKECMRYLNEQQKSRMLFLGMDRLVVSEPSDAIKAMMGTAYSLPYDTSISLLSWCSMSLITIRYNAY